MPHIHLTILICPLKCHLIGRPYCRSRLWYTVSSVGSRGSAEL